MGASASTPEPLVAPMKPVESTPLVDEKGKGGDDPDRMRIWDTLSPRMKILLPSLIIVSGLLNTIALLPFMPEFILDAEPRVQLEAILPLGPYNFSEVCRLLSHFNLYALLMIVILWTVCFPAFKLALMAYTIAFRTSEWLREKSAACLGQNARLSMMEIYFVQIFIMIFARQEHVIFVGITLRIDIEVQAGILLFHLGILLSMICGEIIEQMEYTRANAKITDGTAKEPSSVMYAGVYFPVLRAQPLYGGLALLFTLARFALIYGSFFSHLFMVGEIGNVLPSNLAGLIDRSTLFLHNNWTMASGLSHLLTSDSGYQNFFALDMALFLIFIPTLSALCALYCVIKPTGPPDLSALRLMHLLSRFSNLETFLMAMLVYLTQQSLIITIEVGSAFYCLILYVFALIGSLICTTKAVRGAL